jgi:hypothetical protein
MAQHAADTGIDRIPVTMHYIGMPIPDDEKKLRGKVGNPDRLQRLVIGLALMALTVYGLGTDPTWAKWVALAIQVELIGSAVAGWCPLYWSFGTNSCALR